jgi:hypothetical protein
MPDKAEAPALAIAMDATNNEMISHDFSAKFTAARSAYNSSIVVLWFLR